MKEEAGKIITAANTESKTGGKTTLKATETTSAGTSTSGKSTGGTGGK
jgi:hypothetical protein